MNLVIDGAYRRQAAGSQTGDGFRGKKHGHPNYVGFDRPRIFRNSSNRD